MNQPLRNWTGIIAAFITAAASVAAETAAWPTWRGPSGAGIAPGAQPPLKWSDTENIKWKTKIPGAGFSTPIIWKDRMFLLTAIEVAGGRPAAAAPASDGGGDRKAGKRGKGGGGFGGGPAPTNPYEFVVLALDRNTGKILWQKVARKEVPHEGHHASHGYASASPVTDGEHLYVSFGSRGFYCYDLDGNLKWEKDLGDMKTRGSFGEGASPALAGDRLIINWDSEENSAVIALDKKTGAELWRHKRDERTSWSTPLVVEVGGRLQAIIPATNRTRSYDVQTGDVVWEAGGMTANVIPTAVTGNGMVYVTSGFQGRAVQAIKLTARGDISETDNIVWSSRRQSTPYVPSPVLSGDRLYLSKSNDAFLSCLNALTGEVHYTDQPLEGLRGIYASPVAANGHLFVVGREGLVMVLKDAPKFDVVAKNKLNDKIDASPAMIGNDLYLRGHEYMYCISEG